MASESSLSESKYIPIINDHCFSTGGPIVQYVDEKLNYVSLDRLVKDEVPLDVIKTVPEMGILNIMAYESQGYLFRVGDNFYLMEGPELEIIPSIAFPLFVKRGLKYFQPTEARYLAIPIGTVVDGTITTKEKAIRIHMDMDDWEYDEIPIHTIEGWKVTTEIEDKENIC